MYKLERRFAAVNVDRSVSSCVFSVQFIAIFQWKSLEHSLPLILCLGYFTTNL